MSHFHFIHSSDGDYSLWCITVVNTEDALHLGAVTPKKHLDIKGRFLDLNIDRPLSLPQWCHIVKTA